MKIILFNRFIILLASTVLLVGYFWIESRYPSLDLKASMSEAIVLDDVLVHDTLVENESKNSFLRIFYSLINWMYANWRGMTFGLMLASLLMSLLSCITIVQSKNKLIRVIQGILLGIPLGVCVNCVAPIVFGFKKKGISKETALGTLFSSPTLNITIILMLFNLFPVYFSIIKVLLTFVLLLIVVPFFYSDSNLELEINPNEINPNIIETFKSAFFESSKELFKNFKFIVIRTVPLMILAGFLGSILSVLIPLEALTGLESSFWLLVFVSAIGTFLPVPIAVDLMFGSMLLELNLPISIIFVYTFSLGSYSIYSAFIVSKIFSKKVGVSLFLVIMSLSIIGGYVVEVIENKTIIKVLSKVHVDKNAYSEIYRNVEKSKYKKPIIPQISKIKIYSKQSIEISRQKFYIKSPPEGKGLISDAKKDMFSHSNSIFHGGYFDPFVEGGGVTSGDLNGDGIDDIIINSDGKLFTYINNIGQFQLISIDLKHKQKCFINTVIIIDFNNDGRKEIIISCFEDGIYSIELNKQLQTKQIVRVLKSSAMSNLALAFSDIDKNGFLDIYAGNYSLGKLNRNPSKFHQNEIVMQFKNKFKSFFPNHLAGNSTSVLFSDLKGDDRAELLVGNDFVVPGQGYSLKHDAYRFDQSVLPFASYFSMSLDSADIDNDGDFDLFIAGLSDNNPGSLLERKKHAIKSCNKIENTNVKQLCIDHAIFFSERYNIKVCDKVSKITKKQCIEASIFHIARKKNDKLLCEKIDNKKSLSYNYCQKYFAKNHLLGRVKPVNQKRNENVFLINNKNKLEDNTKKYKIKHTGWSWNSKFADIDNDGYQDLFISNGAQQYLSYAPNIILLNKEGKTFLDINSKQLQKEKIPTAASLYIDYDFDGDLDIMSSPLYGKPYLYKNNSQNNSIAFELIDTKGNRACIGCKVQIEYGDGLKQIKEIKASGGYLSYDSRRLYFGLNQYHEIKNVKIFWNDKTSTDVSSKLKNGYLYEVIR
jgi:uncharacterized membrane protein YraQ (UPF0718 family)